MVYKEVGNLVNLIVSLGFGKSKYIRTVQNGQANHYRWKEWIFIISPYTIKVKSLFYLRLVCLEDGKEGAVGGNGWEIG